MTQLRGLASIVIVLVAAALAALAYRGAHDHRARAASHALHADVLREAEAAGGTLPEAERVVTTRVLGILPGPTVTYRPVASGCLILHEAWPLGPRRGLDCASGQWRVIPS